MNSARVLAAAAILGAASVVCLPEAHAIPPGYSFCVQYCPSGNGWVSCWLNCIFTWCKANVPPQWREGCPFYPYNAGASAQIRVGPHTDDPEGPSSLRKTVIDGTEVTYLDLTGLDVAKLLVEDLAADRDPIESLAVWHLPRGAESDASWIQVATGVNIAPGLWDVALQLGAASPPSPEGAIAFEVVRSIEPSDSSTHAIYLLGSFDPPAPEFRRGDVNGDARVDLADAIFGLSFLFTGGSTPPCMDAADSNDTGSVDLSDPIFLLGYAFLGTRTPPAPGPTVCGVDPTDDSLDCAAYARC